MKEDEKRNKGILSAIKLFQRVPEADYVEEWTHLLSQEVQEESEGSQDGIVIFRLNQQWFGLSIAIFSEIAETRPIHVIPSRNNPIFLGIANLRGQLRLCISLHRLLEVEQQVEKDKKPAFNRILAIQKEEDFWIFPADEVFGIYHFKVDEIGNIPITISKSTANFLKGLLVWQHKSVGLIDEELLFSFLKRSVL